MYKYLFCKQTTYFHWLHLKFWFLWQNGEAKADEITPEGATVETELEVEDAADTNKVKQYRVKS